MELANIIGNIGGLGACVVILAYLGKYALDSLKPTLEDFRKSIEANTIALNTLAERLNRHLDDDKGE